MYYNVFFGLFENKILWKKICLVAEDREFLIDCILLSSLLSCLETLIVDVCAADCKCI